MKSKIENPSLFFDDITSGIKEKRILKRFINQVFDQYRFKMFGKWLTGNALYMRIEVHVICRFCGSVAWLSPDKLDQEPNRWLRGDLSNSPCCESEYLLMKAKAGHK